MNSNTRTLTTAQAEQALFEQRLTEDPFGVAIRKINSHGKANLRYVKCITVQPAANADVSFSSARSVGSWVQNRFTLSAKEAAASARNISTNKSYQALVWGKKKDVQVNIQHFKAVAKGKVTEKAKKSLAPSSRIVSLISDDPYHPSLDIEAPTELDRDKFARAFGVFLKCPVHEDAGAKDGKSFLSAAGPLLVATNSSGEASAKSTQHGTASGDCAVPLVQTQTLVKKEPAAAAATEGSFYPPPLPPRNPGSSTVRSSSIHSSSHRGNGGEGGTSLSNTAGSLREHAIQETSAIVSMIPKEKKDTKNENDEDQSHVSSLTGHGYDQELVEELHNALTELRSELEESRAEASRAVKVAEQAIQSAERSNSVEWQNTVTHKAAEAAALAQKRSASALAKQRIAEERLDGERRAATFWRKQASVAEEEAGALQTRAAAAEVQRAALEEQLARERRLISEQIAMLKSRFSNTDINQREALEAALERNRALEMELETQRHDHLQSTCSDQKHNDENEETPRTKIMKRAFGRSKKRVDDSAASLLSVNATSSSSPVHLDMAAQTSPSVMANNSPSFEQILKVQAEAQLMRQQFEMLKRTTADHLEKLPESARTWAEQISTALRNSESEVLRLQERLAMESASRRKLLHEVQDLRGAVRVYCRPRPSSNSVVSLASQDTLVVHRDAVDSDLPPVSFEFDCVFEPHTQQQDVYKEIEEVCLSVLDGYRICLMACGPSKSGKTCTILGDVTRSSDMEVQIRNHGIQLRTLQQLFTVAERRSDRFKDTFNLTIVQVHNERIRDLLAATHVGETCGKAVWVETKNSKRKPVGKASQDDDTSSANKPSKIEIRTDLHGETVVQGLISVEIASFDDAMTIWKECIEAQSQYAAELGDKLETYQSSSHIVASLKVTSSNITTGIGSIGTLQFVDLAGASIVPSSQSSNESDPSTTTSQCDWKFANRSLETLRDCVEARIQFDRSVPYRNSTLTHVLRDSLEADTKVLLVACISPEPENLEETMATLKFASRMRRVNVGKATKHTMSPP
jgi:kinesin family member C2/C3